MPRKLKSKIELNLIDGKLSFVRKTDSPDTFRDSFNDGDVFRDVFNDDGQWEHNFNNMQGGDVRTLRHPAIQEALKQIRDAADKALKQ